MITLTEAKHAAWLWGARPDLRARANVVLCAYVDRLPEAQRPYAIMDLTIYALRGVRGAVPNFTNAKSEGKT